MKITLSSAAMFLISFGKSFFSLFGSVRSPFGTFFINGFSASSMNMIAGCKSRETFVTKCISIIKPDLPGYLPTMLAGVKSNKIPPTSLHIAYTNDFLPDPLGPPIKIERMQGAKFLIVSEPNGKIQYSVITCRMSPGVGFIPDRSYKI